MKIEGHAKRLAIYFFFDKEGIVDRFVPCFLEDLKRNITDLLIVSNGVPCAKGQEELRKYGELLIRENQGFDVWAYKEALEHITWEKLEEYDEVIMLNSTIMGPVFPLKETFEKMDGQDLDFWGLTKYFQQDVDPSGCCRYGYIPEHIQSHFIACRRSLTGSREFQDYWKNMPQIDSYWEAVGKHEMIFTKYFEDLGYRSGVSVEMDDLQNYSGYPLMMCPVKLIKERRCPIFKRRMFFHDPRDFMSQTAGEQAVLLLDYLKEQTSYNTDYIWESILSRYNQADIVKNMNLTFVLPDTAVCPQQKDREENNKKIALIMYLQYEESIGKYAAYASSVPEKTDLYIITDTKEKEEQICRTFHAPEEGHLNVSVTEHTSDVEILLVKMKALIFQYDLVAIVPDQGGCLCSVMSGSEDRFLNNMLAGKNYVKNIITAFEENPRLGMLAPPFSNHGPYFTNIGKEWRSYYPKVKELADLLGITVPIAEDRPPVGALETMFWFRPEALRPIFEKEWHPHEFRKEDGEPDEEMTASVERLYPYAVQQAGFYPAVLFFSREAETEIQNLEYSLREYNTIMMENGIENYHQYMCNALQETFQRKDFLEKENAQLRMEIQGKDRALEVFIKDREEIEKLSLLQMMKFWLKNSEKRKKGLK